MSTVLWQPAYVALGSNLDDPVAQVTRALSALQVLPRSSLHAVSPLYWSEPLGPSGQPPYVNAVAALLTQLSPESLLDELQRIEAEHGRERSAQRWTARTLDLDILAVGPCRIDTNRLVIPHPELHRREFVLGPWRDIAPTFEVPGLGSVASLALRVDLSTLRSVGGEPVARSSGSTMTGDHRS